MKERMEKRFGGARESVNVEDDDSSLDELCGRERKGATLNPRSLPLLVDALAKASCQSSASHSEVNVTEALVLWHIAHKGFKDREETAKACMTSPTSITRYLANLESLGLIERKGKQIEATRRAIALIEGAV